ncbi:F-actin-monooxygenase mical2-like [Paramacrobiotus metropolitanus]|uniref:F-actin-monooxygenase mical2-like n=1 Tax=Paramacrobiotus metropolitanus TaxID=2943436 RepID=UPI002445E31E|nr:F-actin-monooxygenase mical2-like [Paramacrobiotus metropolitanus]
MSFSWKWKHFQNKLDKRAAQKEYGKGRICCGNKVLIVGAGPCGLRMAIEAALLGAKVVVVEKRDRFSRNNVLHLWPFVITDLLQLGAKKFYPKFCSGNVDTYIYTYVYIHIHMYAQHWDGCRNAVHIKGE